MKLIQTLCVVVYVISFAPLSAAGGTVVLQPPGLNPGDPYRLVFVTSGIQSATSREIADYNTFVQSFADASPLAPMNQIWKAIGSSMTTDARDNTETNPIQASHMDVPIYRVDGLLVAASNSELWSGTIRNPIQTNEFGVVEPVGGNSKTAVWTGTTLSGGSAGYGYFGSESVFYGTYDDTTRRWIQLTTTLTDGNTAHIYAMSGVIYAAVPEPSSCALACIPIGCGAVALAARRRSERHRKPFR
jgi:hypothetical protein